MSVAGSIASNVNSNPVIADPIDLSVPFPLGNRSFPVMMKAVVCFNLLTGDRDMDNIMDVYSPALKSMTMEDARHVIEIFAWNGIRLADPIPAGIQKKPLLALLQLLVDFFFENGFVAKVFPNFENPLSPLTNTSPSREDLTFASNILRLSENPGNSSLASIMGPVLEQVRSQIAEDARLDAIRRQDRIREVNEQLQDGLLQEIHQAQLNQNRLAAVSHANALAANGDALDEIIASGNTNNVTVPTSIIPISNLASTTNTNISPESSSAADERRREEERLTILLLESEKIADAARVIDEANAALAAKRLKSNSSESIPAVFVFSEESLFGGERAKSIKGAADIIKSLNTWDETGALSANGPEMIKMVQQKSASSINPRTFLVIPNQLSKGPLTPDHLLTGGFSVMAVISTEKTAAGFTAQIKRLVCYGKPENIDKCIEAESRTILLPATALVLSPYGIQFFGEALPMKEASKTLKNNYENRLGNFIDLSNSKASLLYAKDIDLLTALAEIIRFDPKFNLFGPDGVTVNAANIVNQLRHNVDILASCFYTSSGSASYAGSELSNMAMRIFGIVRLLLPIVSEYDLFLKIGRLQMFLLGQMTNSNKKSCSFLNCQKPQQNGIIKNPTNIEEICACITGMENVFCVLFSGDYRGTFTKFINHLMSTIFNMNLTITYTVNKIHVNLCLLFHYFLTKPLEEMPLGDPAQMNIWISNFMLKIDFSPHDQALSASGNPFVYLPDKFTETPINEFKKKGGKLIGRPIVDLSNASLTPNQDAATIASTTAANLAAAKLAATAVSNALATPKTPLG